MPDRAAIIAVLHNYYVEGSVRQLGEIADQILRVTDPSQAFDRASAQLLETDLTSGFEQNANVVARRVVMVLRVLFMDEMEGQSAPGPQA